MAQIESITKGPTGRRESNFELLRMLAMFFVLVVHADFAALTVPTSADVASAPAGTAARIFFEMAAIAGVNIFVLISGWFGIRATLKGFMKFLFQVLFYAVVIYLLFVAIGIAPFSWEAIYQSCILEWTENQWFIPSYILLFLFAPVLNAFTEKASGRQLGWMIAGFYLVQTALTLIGKPAQFNEGYSFLSFSGLYLFARWLRLHDRAVNRLPVGWGLVIGTILVETVADYFVIKEGINGVTSWLLSYSSPLVVLESFGFLILFANIRKFSNSIINWISGGCFAVYLIHFNKWVFIHFKDAVKAIYAPLDGPMAILAIGAFLAAVFLGCVLVDKLVRETAWKAVERAVRKSGSSRRNGGGA